jgi:hypothetical protein
VAGGWEHEDGGWYGARMVRKAEDGGKEMGAAVPVFPTSHDIAKDHKAVKNMGMRPRRHRLLRTRRGHCVKTQERPNGEQCHFSRTDPFMEFR